MTFGRTKMTAEDSKTEIAFLFFSNVNFSKVLTKL